MSERSIARSGTYRRLRPMTRPSLLESLKPQHAEVFQSSAGNEGHAKPGQEPASTGGNGNPAPNAEDTPGREGG